MGNVYLLLRGVDRQPLHFIRQTAHGGLSAALLVHGNQPTRIVHVHDGLDAQHRAQKRRRRAHAAALFQVVQIVHREPVANVQLRILHIIAHLFDARARAALLIRQRYQQTFAHRRAQRIHAVNLAIGVFFTQLRRRLKARVAGAAQRGGKADVEDILTRVQNRLHRFDERLRVRCRGLYALRLGQRRIKIGVGDVAFVQIVFIIDAVHVQRQRQYGKLHFLRQMQRKIAAGIGKQCKLIHHILSPHNPIVSYAARLHNVVCGLKR